MNPPAGDGPPGPTSPAVGGNAPNGSEDECSDMQVAFLPSLYAATYTVVFIPGLLANSTALWVLCRFVRQKNKAVIFMVNLSVADLAHVLSLPLRIYYYVNLHWPFPPSLCLFCFYLKYLNMYASICFLACISLQRCFFLARPLAARGWRRRYDVAISGAVWVAVGAACLPLPLLRAAQPAKPGLRTAGACFSDLGLRPLGPAAAAGLLTAAELGGFVLPVAVITGGTWCARRCLRGTPAPVPHGPGDPRRALRMLALCAAVFAVCFTPYHLSLPFFLLAKRGFFSDCAVVRVALTLHATSLGLAGLNCWLDPLVYYFSTAQFRRLLWRRPSTPGHSWMAVPQAPPSRTPDGLHLPKPTPAPP
ncbi:putative P2Y purinoceptor 10 [Tachyglossus aculeatus]|uniref:putative P2Y purinoceptor 10 n=1 Tax=Tachyglossus aculeatus TaxID=9261 RepID=UPI0018F78E04|nr:putative P2Y purinoceptor 10 [Tachyglossus aculeatus]